jgi:hypothetical protein
VHAKFDNTTNAQLKAINNLFAISYLLYGWHKNNIKAVFPICNKCPQGYK